MGVLQMQKEWSNLDRFGSEKPLLGNYEHLCDEVLDLKTVSGQAAALQG